MTYDLYRDRALCHRVGGCGHDRYGYGADHAQCTGHGSASLPLLGDERFSPGGDNTIDFGIQGNPPTTLVADGSGESYGRTSGSPSRVTTYITMYSWKM